MTLNSFRSLPKYVEELGLQSGPLPNRKNLNSLSYSRIMILHLKMDFLELPICVHALHFLKFAFTTLQRYGATRRDVLTTYFSVRNFAISNVMTVHLISSLLEEKKWSVLII